MEGEVVSVRRCDELRKFPFSQKGLREKGEDSREGERRERGELSVPPDRFQPAPPLRHVLPSSLPRRSSSCRRAPCHHSRGHRVSPSLVGVEERHDREAASRSRHRRNHRHRTPAAPSPSNEAKRKKVTSLPLLKGSSTILAAGACRRKRGDDDGGSYHRCSASPNGARKPLLQPLEDIPTVAIPSPLQFGFRLWFVYAESCSSKCRSCCRCFVSMFLLYSRSSSGCCVSRLEFRLLLLIVDKAEVAAAAVAGRGKMG
ncbi:uncharacterized protein LOC107636861 [Arachis ipaensis]|uniref:uncharacterized protein LOC107636861 n=1 Tax=Arachis ipaensis TaxID=130454 RepID=UPI0007AF2F28|nr:uncharacterized protein LOC107636861 [Arachis ipaensis]